MSSRPLSTSPVVPVAPVGPVEPVAPDDDGSLDSPDYLAHLDLQADLDRAQDRYERGEQP